MTIKHIKTQRAIAINFKSMVTNTLGYLFIETLILLTIFQIIAEPARFITTLR